MNTSTQSSNHSLVRPEGHTLAYRRVAGRQPGVVFLGGFMSDMTGTKALALEAWCRDRGRAFVRFDYLGHGTSSGRFAEGTVGRWVGDAVAVLDSLTEGPQVLVGSSMGGWIMLLAALARPQRVAGLLGIASAPDFTEALIWGRMDEALRERLRREGVLYQPSEYSDQPYAITWRLIEEGREHLLLDSDIPLHCPVRLLHGMEDRDVPWESSLRLSRRLAGADLRLTLVKDGDHRLCRPVDLALLTAILGDLLGQLDEA